MGNSEEILIAKKGFTKEDENELRKIALELKNIPEIQEVYFKNTLASNTKKHIKNYYYLLANFKNEQISPEQIKEKIQNIYLQFYDSPLYEPINLYDPLELFVFDAREKQDNVYKLDNFGYVLKATTNIDTSSAELSKQLYDKLNVILAKHTDTLIIAPFFYLVENSTYIKNDAQKIMSLATLLLLVLYFFILKNTKLFFNSILAIASSILGAIMISSFFYESINVLSLAFGVSITTISIDYMFHYYFHNNFSPAKSRFQKNVFFGFVTTVGVFIIFSFIDIKFFAQLALFGTISISIAYLIFSFAFVYLDIQEPPYIPRKKRAKRGIHPLYIIVISIILFIVSFLNLEFDYELKNLDYQNQKLIATSTKFNQDLHQKRYQKILISGETKEKVLENYEELLSEHPNMIGIGSFLLSQKKCMQKLVTLQQYNFEILKNDIEKASKAIGFEKGFEKAYTGIEKLNCNMPMLDDFKFKIIEEDGLYYTLALIDQADNIQEKSYAYSIDIGKILKQDMNKIKEKLIIFVYISVAFIFIILLFITRGNFYYPLMYILFPVSIVLFIISLFYKINIMHIFALVILLAISIDYGFYLYEMQHTSKTKIAIKYALLSTFCGFGSLILSGTVALFSIGLVITIGISAIFLLLYVSL
jgi:predicted exporter